MKTVQELFLESISSTFAFLVNNDLLQDNFSRLDSTGLKELYRGRINVAMLLLIKILDSETSESTEDLKNL